MTSTVRTFSIEIADNPIYNLDGSLEVAIGILTDILNEIPEAYRASAIVDFSDNRFTVNYCRPETAEETAIREMREADRKAFWEAQERAEYERLKKKYDEALFALKDSP